MNWQDIITIVGSLGAFMFWMFNKLDADIKSLNTTINGTNDKMDGSLRHLTAMQAEQSKRTDSLNQRLDKLYQMFIDLLKEKK